MITIIRRTTGTLIQGFGFGCLLFSGVGKNPPEVSLTGPDPSRDLLYACYPKSVAWYYSAFTVMKSWNFVACGIIMILGAFIAWKKTPVVGSKNRWPYTDFETVCFVIGGAIAFWFVSRWETAIIYWIMDQGFKPPAVKCFPLYSGGS